MNYKIDTLFNCHKISKYMQHTYEFVLCLVNVLSHFLIAKH